MIVAIFQVDKKHTDIIKAGNLLVKEKNAEKSCEIWELKDIKIQCV